MYYFNIHIFKIVDLINDFLIILSINSLLLYLYILKFIILSRDFLNSLYNLLLYKYHIIQFDFFQLIVNIFNYLKKFKSSYHIIYHVFFI